MKNLNNIEETLKNLGFNTYLEDEPTGKRINGENNEMKISVVVKDSCKNACNYIFFIPKENASGDTKTLCEWLRKDVRKYSNNYKLEITERGFADIFCFLPQYENVIKNDLLFCK